MHSGILVIAVFSTLRMMLPLFFLDAYHDAVAWEACPDCQVPEGARKSTLHSSFILLGLISGPTALPRTPLSHCRQ